MTKNKQPMNSVFVRYEGIANFKFVERGDFFDDDIESVDGRSESEDLIASACPEIDTFTITDAEYDGKFLTTSARVSGVVLLLVRWNFSDVMRPDQITFLEASVVSYISAGIDCVQSVDVTLKTQDHKVIAAA